MSLKVAIVDYGMGNLASVSSAFATLGIATWATHESAEIAAADAIVLPGVGAFGHAMENLRSLDLVGPLTDLVMVERRPFLGICLGMQLIAESSAELGRHEGLGWIEGQVDALPPDAGHPVPHVGWSEVAVDDDDPLFARIGASACFYFDHSYVLKTDTGIVAGTADYGTPIAAVVRRDNIVATQFHPEKSQRAGLKLLRNFTNAAADARREAA